MSPKTRTKALGRRAWGRSHQSLAGASPHGRLDPWRCIVIRAVMHLSSEMQVCTVASGPSRGDPSPPAVPVALGLGCEMSTQHTVVPPWYVRAQVVASLYKSTTRHNRETQAGRQGRGRPCACDVLPCSPTAVPTSGGCLGDLLLGARAGAARLDERCRKQQHVGTAPRQPTRASWWPGRAPWGLEKGR